MLGLSEMTSTQKYGMDIAYHLFGIIAMIEIMHKSKLIGGETIGYGF